MNPTSAHTRYLTPRSLPYLALGALLLTTIGCASATHRAVRAQLTAAYDEYTTAYVAEDFDAAMRLIGPGFHGRTLEGEEFDRARFLQIVRMRMDYSDYDSFNVTILDLVPEDDTWVATIREEFVSTARDGRGNHLKLTEMYVTRDAWQQLDGQWVALSSEVLEQDVKYNGLTREAYIESMRQASTESESG